MYLIYVTRGIETSTTGVYVYLYMIYICYYLYMLGIDTSTTGVYVSDLYVSDLYMLLQVLTLPPQEYMYLIYICYYRY